ncbi:MAG: helix-turn-helix domain-containing protein [Bacillota bacterium]
MENNFDPESRVPLICNENETFPKGCRFEECFRLIIIENGTMLLRNGQHRKIITAPTVLCLNEKEYPVIEENSNLKAKSVYFKPSFINSNFTFDNIRDWGNSFTLSDIRDRNWLICFLERKETFDGIMNVGYLVIKQINWLFTSLEREMREKRDGWWPCRSRSFFLEILFILERAFFTQQSLDKAVLNGISEDISKVVFYLHTHYQQKITISKLVEEFHINRTTLNDRFSKEVGYPVMTYLIKHRINLASLLLRDTLVPVSEIMERVGFKDSAHFVRMFKKYLGCSPLEYRKNNCLM